MKREMNWFQIRHEITSFTLSDLEESLIINNRIVLVSTECWKDDGWQNIPDSSDDTNSSIVTFSNSFENCCDQCKTSTLYQGCAYFVYNEAKQECSLFSIFILADRIKDPNY